MQKVDYEAWRNSPVAKWFFDTVLEQEIDDIKASLLSGSSLSDTADKVAMYYVEHVGITLGIDIVRNLDPFGDENAIEGNRTPPFN